MSAIAKKENNSHLLSLVEQIKQINTEGLNDEQHSGPITNVIEEQKIYYWIRLFLREEPHNVKIDDTITINFVPTGEKLETKFIAWGKKGLDRDSDGEITSYSAEDDKRVLCLMVDTKMINFNNDIPFIRKLFRTGYHYEETIFKKSDLLFINKSNGFILDYFQCSF